LQEASSVDVDSDANKMSGMFDFSVSVRPGKGMETSRKVIEEEIWKLKNKDVSADELKKVKNQTMLAFAGGLKTIAGKARWLALKESRDGGFESIFTDLDKYNQVTAEDIKRVAKQYLVSSKLNVVSVLPKSIQN
jgi:zinc protease